MMQKADIRKCSAADVKEIAEIEKNCIPDGWSEKAFEEWLSGDGRILLGAFADGRMIGFVNGSWVIDEGELLNIAVLEKYRRRGTAVLLYEQIEKLKSNWKAIVAGIVSGIISCVLCVYAFSLIFGLTHAQYVTLLPKSITTAIGRDVSTELGGITTITVAVIIITGVFGNIIGEPICKLFHITEPVAKGVGMGSSAHAIGTAKAMEMGEVEGAISSLSIAVTGLLTVIAASIAANLY